MTPQRCRLARIRKNRLRTDSTAASLPVLFMLAAMSIDLPPGAAARSRISSPGKGARARTANHARWVDGIDGSRRGCSMVHDRLPLVWRARHHSGQTRERPSARERLRRTRPQGVDPPSDSLRFRHACHNAAGMVGSEFVFDPVNKFSRQRHLVMYSSVNAHHASRCVDSTV